MKNNQVIVIGIVVAALVIIVGAVFFIPKNQPANPPPAQTEVDTSTSSTSSLQDWQTYRNEAYWFILQYPKAWNISEEQQEDRRTLYSVDWTSPSATFPGVGVEIQRDFDIEGGSSQTTKEEGITVDGNQAVKSYGFRPDGTAFIEVLVKRNSYRFVISLDEVDKTYSVDIFDHMLSTFKFTK